MLSRDFAKDLCACGAHGGQLHGARPCYAAESARASRAMQYFFINGRFVKNRTMMAALEAAYKGVMMQGKFPGCVLSIEMPPQLVDVNVHPAKTEVRFAREKDVFDAVYQSVKCVLITPRSTEKVFSFGGAERAFPADEKAPDAAAKKELSESAPAEEPARGPGALRPASRAVPDAPVRPVPARPEPSAVPLPGQVKAHSEMITALSGESAVPYRSAKAPDIWADEDAAEYVGFMPHTVCRRQEGTPGVQDPRSDRALNSFAAGETAGTENTAAPQMEAETPHQTAFAPVEEEQRRDSLRFVGEVFDTYIVTQRGNDMCLLDKHAAHERIIYESLAASYGKVSSQMLLVPVTVQLSAEEKDALVQSEMLLQDSGLEVEDFGGNLSGSGRPGGRRPRMWRTCGGAGQQAGLQPAVYHQRKNRMGAALVTRAARPSRREIKRTLHSCCAWRRMC